jgi:hypothetical protein
MPSSGNIVESIIRDFWSRFTRFGDSGWKIVGNGDAGVSIPLGPVSVGFNGGYLDVQVTQGEARRDDVYRCSYGGVSVAAGVSPVDLPADGSISEGLPSITFGQIKRLPGSPDDSGEPGPPTGFRGEIGLFSISGSAILGVSATIIFLGAPNAFISSISDPTFYARMRRSWAEIREGKIPDSPFYKYATIVGGAQISGPGAGLSAAKGIVSNITLDGQRVAYSGRVA